MGGAADQLFHRLSRMESLPEGRDRDVGADECNTFRRGTLATVVAVVVSAAGDEGEGVLLAASDELAMLPVSAAAAASVASAASVSEVTDDADSVDVPNKSSNEYPNDQLGLNH